MKRTNHNPIILPLPTFEMHSFEAQPRILPFPTRASRRAPARRTVAHRKAARQETAS